MYCNVINKYQEGQFGIRCGNHVFKDRLNVVESLYKSLAPLLFKETILNNIISLLQGT